MKKFKIFKNPQGVIEVVKVGWSWPAFFFTFIWAMIKKMYLVGIGGLILFGIVGEIFDTIIGKLLPNPTSQFRVFWENAPVGTGIGVLFALYGNLWREKNLVSRGFEFVDIVHADNVEGAINKFSEEYKSGHTDIPLENAFEKQIKQSTPPPIPNTTSTPPPLPKQTSAPPPLPVKTVTPPPLPKISAVPPPLPPEEEWWIGIDGKQEGPYKISKIKELLSADKSSLADSYIWKDGMAEWKPISDIDKFK